MADFYVVGSDVAIWHTFDLFCRFVLAAYLKTNLVIYEKICSRRIADRRNSAQLVHEDVEAMLQFYDDPTVYSVEDFITGKKGERVEKSSEEFGIKTQKFGKNLVKFGINPQEFGIKFGINAEKFGEKAIAIISIIILKSDISAKSLSDIFEMTPRAIEKILEKLKANNIIRRVGGRKAGHWEVID